MQIFKSIVPLAVVLSAAGAVQAGLIAYGVCQSGMSARFIASDKLLMRPCSPCVGCNVVAVACYAGAGATFGTVAAPVAIPAIAGCNAALGSCMALCATFIVAPIP